jgi:hypothetical protein
MMLSARAEGIILSALLAEESMMLSAQGHASALTLRARLLMGSAESIILVVTRSKGLVNTVIANGVLVVVIGNVAILGILVVVVVIALSKGLVVTVVAKCILIVAIGNVTLLGILQVPSLYILIGHVSAR